MTAAASQTVQHPRQRRKRGEATLECTPSAFRTEGHAQKRLENQVIYGATATGATAAQQPDGFQGEITPLESPRRKRGDRTDGWRITFIPKPSSIEPVFRFKRLLKFALRACELRCVNIERPAEPAGANP